jgi:hypothetical protein
VDSILELLNRRAAERVVLKEVDREDHPVDREHHPVDHSVPVAEPEERKTSGLVPAEATDNGANVDSDPDPSPDTTKDGNPLDQTVVAADPEELKSPRLALQAQATDNGANIDPDPGPDTTKDGNPVDQTVVAADPEELKAPALPLQAETVDNGANHDPDPDPTKDRRRRNASRRTMLPRDDRNGDSMKPAASHTCSRSAWWFRGEQRGCSWWYVGI